EVPFGEIKMEQLKQLIQAKNRTELEIFLSAYDVDPTVKSILLEITQLYWKPDEVLQRAKRLSLNERMAETINNLKHILNLISMNNYIIYCRTYNRVYILIFIVE